MKSPISWIIALLTGALVLAGLFLSKWVPVLGDVQAMVLQWAVLLASLALLVGVINLLAVHGRKVRAAKSSSFYSVVLIVSLVATIGIAAWSGPTGSLTLWIMNHVQIPIESSLVALLAILLAYTAARMARYRVNLMTALFIVVVLFILLGAAPIYGSSRVTALLNIKIFQQISTWINQSLVTAGARGILLGVALGTIAAGLRILLGADRPYGG